MEEIGLLLTVDIAEKLSKANLTNSQILIADPKELENSTCILLGDIKKIKCILAKERLKNKFNTVDQIPSWDRIKTGCLNVDSILKGGIPINGIVELYGASGVGKSQFCLQVSLQIQLPHLLGGQEKEVLYICTEDVFPCKRSNQLANIWQRKFNLDKDFEDHIYIHHVADSIQLNKCLTKHLPTFMSYKNIGIIIIDSIAGLFRSENECPNYVARSQDFRTITNNLLKLQMRFNCGILVTNQVVDNVTTGIAEPCLGLAWSNNITNRFCLSKTRDNIRIFEVIFSPDLPSAYTNISIETEGLINKQ